MATEICGYLIGTWYGVDEIPPGGGIPAPPQLPHPAPVLVYSTSPDRSNPLPLDGAELSGTVYIFADNDEIELSNMWWYLDPPDSADLPPIGTQNEYVSFVRADSNGAPWDLRGGTDEALPWDTATDPSKNGPPRATFDVDGAHIVAVKAAWTDGMSDDFAASITIKNNVDPVPPPGAPAITSVTTPASGQAKVSWLASSGSPTSYNVQHSTTSNFSSPTTISAGNVLTTTISGLPAGLRYFRVQAVGPGGTSAYGPSASATVTSGSGVAPSPRNVYHGIGGADAFIKYGYTQGPVMNKTTTANGGKFTGPGQWVRTNHDRTKPTTLSNMGNIAIENAESYWASTAPYRRPSQTYGPRGFLTHHVSMGPAINAKGTNSVPSFEQMAQVASGKWDNEYKEMFSSIMNSTYGGHPRGYWSDGRITFLSNEANAPWYSDWSGIDVGLTDTTKNSILRNATAANYPNGAHLLMQQAAVDGDRGPMFLACWRRIRDMRDLVGGNSIPLGLNMATPGSGTGGSTVYNPTAWPPASEGLWDIIGGNIYVRSDQRPTYISGDKNLYSSWDMSVWTDSINEMIARSVEYNRPFEMLEWGTTVNAPDVEPPYTNGPANKGGDEGLRICWRWLWERLETVDVSHLGWFCINNTTETKGATYRINYSTQVEATFPLTIAEVSGYFGFV